MKYKCLKKKTINSRIPGGVPQELADQGRSAKLDIHQSFLDHMKSFRSALTSLPSTIRWQCVKS